MSENNGQKPDSRENVIRETVAKLATLLLNEYVPPDRYCVVISIQSGPSAKLAHHCNNVSGSLEEVALNYSLVAAAAMHAGRMAVIESAPAQMTNTMVARFFNDTQKHLLHLQAVEEAKAKRLEDETP